MQSKSTFLEFLRGIHRYKFGRPKKFFRGEIIQGEWRNFHRAGALFLTGVEFHFLPCVLVCFLVEFDLLFEFCVLSLDSAFLFIYVHEHDRLCFPMSTEETAGEAAWPSGWGAGLEIRRSRVQVPLWPWTKDILSHASRNCTRRFCCDQISLFDWQLLWFCNSHAVRFSS